VAVTRDGDDGTRSAPMSIDHAEHPTYVPPISFAEVWASGHRAVPAPGADDLGYGPLTDAPCGEFEPVPDSLEAFVDTWGAAGPSPADTPFPSR
jgi:hypothetical protein